MTIQARRLPDDSGARSTGRRAESVSGCSGRSSSGPESPVSFLPASSDNRSIASWQHVQVTLPDRPAIAGRPAVRRSPSALPPESVSRHDRSRHSCKHERFPNGLVRRFLPPVHTPHGKPCVAFPFGSHRLPCPFRRHRLMRRSSNPESTRRRRSIRFGTGLPPEDDDLAPPRLSRRQVGGLAPRKRDVRPSVSVGPGRPLVASTCCWVDCRRMAGLSPAFRRRDLSLEDSYARDVFGSVCFAGLASQPGSARFPALTPVVLVSRTCERCRSSIHAAMSTSNGFEPERQLSSPQRVSAGPPGVFRLPIPGICPASTGRSGDRPASAALRVHSIDPRAVRISAVDTAELDPPSRV